MPIQVTCGGCGKTINAPDKFLGKVGKCPGCGEKVKIVPDEGAGAAPAPAPKAAPQPAPKPKPAPAPEPEPESEPEEDDSAAEEEQDAAEPKKKLQPPKSVRGAKAGGKKAVALKGKIPAATSRRGRAGGGASSRASRRGGGGEDSGGSTSRRGASGGRSARGAKRGGGKPAKTKEPAQPLEGAPGFIGARFVAVIIDKVIALALMFAVIMALSSGAFMDGIEKIKKAAEREGQSISASAGEVSMDAPVASDMTMEDDVAGGDAVVDDTVAETTSEGADVPIEFSEQSQQDVTEALTDMFSAVMTGLIAGIVVFLLYPILMEGFVGGTGGKLIFGLRVVKNADNMPCGIVSAILRNIVKWFPFVGFISCVIGVFTARKRALHDMVAGTVVIKLGATEEEDDEEFEDEDGEDDEEEYEDEDDDEEYEDEEYEEDKD